MDVKTILQSLNEHKVRFVIIGATAGIAHGYARLTKDLDIFVEPTRENVEKTFKALTAVGYDIMDTTVEEALEKKLLFRQYILELDIHPSVTGIDWESLWRNKVEFRFQGENVYFSSLEDMIKMKKAAGRPQDLVDLQHLEEIKRQKMKQN